MYCFHGKVNWGHVVCPLYGGSLYLEEFDMGDSTVHISQDLVFIVPLPPTVTIDM